MTVETSPASAAPARKRAGRRKRSERNTSASLGADRVFRGVLGRSGLVPNAPHGDDRRGVPELPPELTDVDVDGSRVAREGVAPDPLEQLVAGEHEAVVVEELPEQVELLRRQLDV